MDVGTMEFGDVGETALLMARMDELEAGLSSAEDNTRRMEAQPHFELLSDIDRLLPFDVRYDFDGGYWKMFVGDRPGGIVYVNGAAVPYSYDDDLSDGWLRLSTSRTTPRTFYLLIRKYQGTLSWYVGYSSAADEICMPLAKVGRTASDGWYVKTYHHGVMHFATYHPRTVRELAPTNAGTAATDSWGADVQADAGYRPAVTLLTRVYYDTSSHKLYYFTRRFEWADDLTLKAVSAESRHEVFQGVAELPGDLSGSGASQ